MIQKTAESTVDLIGNKIAERIIKFSKISPQNSSETVVNEHDKHIPKEWYISPEERQKTIDDLKLISYYINGILKKKLNLVTNWVEIKDDSRRTCNTNSQIMLKAIIFKNKFMWL